VDLAACRLAGSGARLDVVERNEPNKAPSAGQIFPGQFSFGGISPGRTIRVRGDGIIRIRLRNLLGADFGKMGLGPSPDPPRSLPRCCSRSNVTWRRRQMDPIEGHRNSRLTRRRSTLSDQVNFADSADDVNVVGSLI
jgi:hypothetical protein